jgi:hypothetical protein
MNDDLIRAETKVAYRGFVPDVVAQAFARGMRRARTMFASNNRECGDVSNGTFSWQLSRMAHNSARPFHRRLHGCAQEARHLQRPTGAARGDLR